MLSKEEKEELIKLAKSEKLRKEFKKLSECRYNPFIENGKINSDKFLKFLNEYNEFINHAQKPFKKIIDKDMRL